MPVTSDNRGAVAVAASYLYRFGRSLSQPRILRAMVPARLRAAVQRRLMSRAILLLPDRQYLEQVILPSVASLHPQRVLDIGVEWYTQSHGRAFPAVCEYWTLDRRPEVACHGSQGRHIIGNALEVDIFFAPGSLDVVLLNGLFGFGIDHVSEQERMIGAVREVLRPGGRLLVGWDRGQGPLKDPLELESIQRHFAHVPPPGLSSRITLPGSSHIYDWFVAC